MQTIGTNGDAVIGVVHAGGEVDLCRWLDDGARVVEEGLVAHRAVLLRGFRALTAERFEAAMSKLVNGIFLDNGEHNRETLSGGVATPVFYPSTEKILWHNENSFNLRWPRRICFRCEVPAAAGGETPLVDTSLLLQRLDPAIRARFAEKHIRYVRNYEPGLGLSWQKTFRVETKAAAEQYCRENGIAFQWHAGTLRTIAVRKAIVPHPSLGVPCWFAQPTHWHPFWLPAKVRQTLLDLYGAAGLPRNCFYGDGSAIEESVLAELEGLYTELEVRFPWERNDVLIVDNVAAAHARNPFSGPRSLMVCMGDMASFENLQVPGLDTVGRA